MDTGLADLYPLHKLDLAMVEIRQRAAALDGGKALKVQYEALKTEHAEVLGVESKLKEENKTLEEQVQLYTAKLKDLDKLLFSGKLVNPKEIAGYEAEIGALKQKRNTAEERLLELMEAIPAAEAAAKPARAALSKVAKAYDEKRKNDVAESAALQEQFTRLTGERGPLTMRVRKPLLDQYEGVRAKFGGIGMGVLNGTACGACGTQLPTKVVEMVKEDRIVTCESCHRILFSPVAD